ALSEYVAASIVGGYVGRLLAGLGAAYLDWRAAFVAIGAGLLAVSVPIGRMRAAGERAAAAEPPSARLALRVLGEGSFARVYVVAFSFFFVFASLLNFLPFRLAEIRPAG